MIFQVSHLYIIGRVNVFLHIDCFHIPSQRTFPIQVLPEIFKNIIIITHIEGLKYLRIGQVRHSLCPHVHNKFRFYRFAEPDTFRIDPCHFFPGFQPERKGNKRRNITAEAVYDAGPHFQRINLVVP